VVSPDGQRTMRPYLGAAKELDVDDLPLQAIAGEPLRLSASPSVGTHQSGRVCGSN